MKPKDILEMAGDPRFISGIYNYCDRWCERCQFTSRCLVYAQEQASTDGSESNDINNEAFWFDNQFPKIEQALEAADLPLIDFDHQEKIESVRDAVEVIRWYQFQIAVKIMRALMGNDDEDEETDESPFAHQKDSDGSVKVALLGMSRSIGAWGRLSEEFPDQAQEVVPLLVHLERRRRRTELSFPNAMNFIRPGFDEARMRS